MMAFIIAFICWATLGYLAITVVTEGWDDFQQWLQTRNEPDLTIDDYVNMGIDGHKSKVEDGSSTDIRRR